MYIGTSKQRRMDQEIHAWFPLLTFLDEELLIIIYPQKCELSVP